jgi:hypothetical protein
MVLLVMVLMQVRGQVQSILLLYIHQWLLVVVLLLDQELEKLQL